jgi:hypothetical protein
MYYRIIALSKRCMKLLSAGMTLVFAIACQRAPIVQFQTEVTNDVLRQEILAYHDSILSSENANEIAKGDSVYVWVYFKELNDSMTRYSLEYLCDLDVLSVCPAEFVCMIGGHPVFFSAAGGCSQYGFQNHYFGIPTQQSDALLKHFFPTKYQEKLKQEKQTREMGYATKTRKTSHPTICFLTFLRDSLINKQYKKGMGRDHINLDGKDVLM